MAKLKYMGTAHVRTIPAGSDWNGRLAEPLDKDVVFSIKNGHLFQTGSLSPAVVDLILEDPDIIDVSDYEVAPTGKAEEMWHATPHSEGRKKGATSKVEKVDVTTPEAE